MNSVCSVKYLYNLSIQISCGLQSVPFWSDVTINLGVGGSIPFLTARALRLGCSIVVEAEATHVFLGRSL